MCRTLMEGTRFEKWVFRGNGLTHLSVNHLSSFLKYFLVHVLGEDVSSVVVVWICGAQASVYFDWSFGYIGRDLAQRCICDTLWVLCSKSCFSESCFSESEILFDCVVRPGKLNSPGLIGRA